MRKKRLPQSPPPLASAAGSLTDAASQIISQNLPPYPIAGFASAFPKVRIATQTGNKQEALEALTTTASPSLSGEGPALRQDVRLEAFMEDHMLLLVLSGHA